MTMDPSGTDPSSRTSAQPWRAPVLGVLFIAAGLAFLAGSNTPA